MSALRIVILLLGIVVSCATIVIIGNKWRLSNDYDAAVKVCESIPDRATLAQVRSKVELAGGQLHIFDQEKTSRVSTRALFGRCACQVALENGQVVARTKAVCVD